MNYKQDTREVTVILDQIISLLNSVNGAFENEKKVYKYFRNECACATNEEEANDIRREILRTYTHGSGSLNDLVLSSGSNILPKDEEFERLSNKLFETLRNQL